MEGWREERVGDSKETTSKPREGRTQVKRWREVKTDIYEIKRKREMERRKEER